MKRITLLTVLLALVLAGLMVNPAQAQSSIQVDLARVRNATAKYHSTAVAKANGYNFIPGLDGCYITPGVGGMGYHLINGSIIDSLIDPLTPEALVYAPMPDGSLQLAAVEYVVSRSGWDANHSQPPTLFGQTYEIDTEIDMYELHVWIWKPNPLGIFFDWNPFVSCR